MARHSSLCTGLRVARSVGLAGVLCVAAGCSDGGVVTSPSTETESAPATADNSSDEELFLDVENTPADATPVEATPVEATPVEATPVDATPVTEAPVVVSFDPVVETGVPGIDSDDAFCRSWSEFAGSIQAISLAWIIQSPADAAILEVAAANAVVDAAAGLAEHLPAEIESNRQAFTIDVPTPTLRRAETALATLGDAGVSDDAIELLGDAWIAALTDAGVDAVDVQIDVPEGAEGLGEAAAAFALALPSFVEDPTLNTTAFDISPSLAYISDNCPDQATLAGNDNIE